MTRTRFASLFFAIALLVCAESGGVRAAEGGYTNYYPGFYGDFAVAVAPEPGFYLTQWVYGYSADGGRFVQNGSINTDFDLKLAAYVPFGLMVLDLEILGARYSFGGWIPVQYQDLSVKLSSGPLARSDSGDKTGVGDIGLIPVYLWWDLGKNFHIAAFEQITAPSGTYNKNKSLNNSLNYWSFDSNVAVTYLNEKMGIEISADVGYIFNTKNNATHYQTGQEFHVDYMFNKFLFESFGIGVQGFYYRQVTGDSGGGATLGSFKADAAGIGPAVMWTKQFGKGNVVKSLLVTFKWLHEYHRKNRLKGDHLLLNTTLGF